MKRIFTLIVLGMFTAAIAGCEASAKVGDPTDTDASYSKKTVERTSPSGDTTLSDVNPHDCNAQSVTVLLSAFLMMPLAA